MSKSLSERLDALAISVECDTYSHEEVALLREAAALARRVEGAPVATLEFGEHGGQSLHLRDADMESLTLVSQRVALVPVEGGTDVH